MSEYHTHGNSAGDSGWVTTEVAAEALGVDPRTICTYIYRGDLEAKPQGKVIEKRYLVSIDSVYALRDRTGFPRRTRGKTREKSATVEDLTDLICDITAQAIRSSSEAADLCARLQPTEQAESTLRESLERERAEEVRREAERLRAELDQERGKGF